MSNSVSIYPTIQWMAANKLKSTAIRKTISIRAFKSVARIIDQSNKSHPRKRIRLWLGKPKEALNNPRKSGS
jgi:hypothetical protein